MLKFVPQKLDGVYLVENFSARDERGAFVKTFHLDKFRDAGFSESFTESYYSLSSKGVIRGMHFQAPPHEHIKLVYVTQGRILDVILDIRPASPTFGKHISLELSEYGASILIPKGCAHGFLALSEFATVVYNVSSVYNSTADQGIRWNSFGFNWPVDKPVISERDNTFPEFINFVSPF